MPAHHEEEAAKAAHNAQARPEPRDSDGPPSPPHSPRRKRGHKRRTFEKPVAWLLGRQLLGSVKGILLYSAYGKKLDPRDWMTSSPVSFDPPDEGIVREQDSQDKGEFWFDYIADTGDGMRATYSIAYLCMSDLYLPELDPAKVRADEEVRAAPADGLERLPRGEFLLVGGDTAYHASDYMTLATRVQQTFNWAYDDLAEDQAAAGRPFDLRTRPIFGIPGNHDYYDQLDGFRRQFRQPAEPAFAQLNLVGFQRVQSASYFALRLPFGWWLWALDTEVGQIDDRQREFFGQFCQRERRQENETEVVVPPDKLIVATCSPTTTFGKLADPEDYKSADAFGQLGIGQPFLPKDMKKARRLMKEVRKRVPVSFPYDLAETGDERLSEGQCRLDLSGDVHHYARYWGPPPPAGSATPRGAVAAELERLVPDESEREELEKKNRPVAHSYASVVSGIGGAFHHPSQTYVGEVREQSLYPSEALSTAEVAGSLLKFWNIWGGGYVWLAGLLVAFVFYFAFTVPQSSRQFLHNLPQFGLDLTEPVQVTPTALTPPDADAPASEAKDASGREVVRPFWKSALGLEGVLLPPDSWLPPGPCRADSPRYFYGPCRVPAPWDFWLGILVALVASAPLFVATFWKRLYLKHGMKRPGVVKAAGAGGSPGADAKPSGRVLTREGEEIRPTGLDPEIFAEPDRALWTFFALAALMFFGGMAMVKPYRGHVTPFGSSLLVLLTLVWAGACVALGLRYSEFLFKKSHRDHIHAPDWALPWALSAAALVAVTLGLWSFGRNTMPALLVSDMTFVLVAAGLLAGLVLLPFLAGGTLLSNSGAAVRFVGKLLIGLWHFALQAFVPLVLVRKASLLTLLLAAAVIVVGMVVGERLLRRFNAWALAAVWVALGALTLALPVWLVSPAGSLFTRQWFMPEGAQWFWWRAWFPQWPVHWTGWWGLVPSLLAAGFGAVMCCYWFGWYLAVCFAFNGHNNEVGGAARIERFKQFIRFRLREDGVTGYVIGFDDPAEHGAKLRPHVVDVFHLCPKGKRCPPDGTATAGPAAAA